MIAKTIILNAADGKSTVTVTADQFHAVIKFYKEQMVRA